MDIVGTHGTTFGGSPLACSLGYHVLTRLSEREFVSRVQETGAYIHKRLSNLPKWFPGAGFKRQAEELGKYTRAMAEEPFKFAKGAVVSSLATLVRATALIQLKERGEYKPSFVSSCFEALYEGQAGACNESTIRSAAGTAYSGECAHQHQGEIHASSILGQGGSDTVCCRVAMSISL